MKFLVDTNVLIALEPTSADLEPTATIAAEFVALAAAGPHQLARHPAQERDRERDRNEQRREARRVLLSKYPTLPRVRPMPPIEQSILGAPEVGSNAWVDNELLAAVHALAVDFLVTEDTEIHRKARRLGLEDRVLFVAGARDLLQTLVDRPPVAPPAVDWVTATELDERDPIFASLRSDYADFDAWLGVCRREERQCAVIRASDGKYAAVSIIVRKADKFGVVGDWLKIGTFKVADEHRGRRYAELLLKALFKYRHSNGFSFAYLTVFERHDGLIQLLEDFGFRRHIDRTGRGEAILVKTFRPGPEDALASEPLDFHVRFGPPAIALVEDQTFVVPIEPRFHRLLFPDAEPQLGLPGLQLDRPFGNGLRKAYLCHAATRAISPGATLLFYRSHDVKGVTCLGVVEDARRETDVEAIARLVGTRTVYTLDEIRAMTDRTVLVIRFRQDRILPEPIRLAELVESQLLSAHPQTVSRVRREGVPWLRRQIGA